MNIYLIPYTWVRHLVMGFILAAAALLAWWWVLAFWVVINPWLFTTFHWCFSRSTEGVLFLPTVASWMAFTTLMAEGSLRRRKQRWRWLLALNAGFGAWVLSLMGYGFWSLIMPLFATEGIETFVSDSSLTTLRYRFPTWFWCGYSAGGAAFLVRRFHAWTSRKTGWGKDPTQEPLITWKEWLGILFAHIGGGAVAGAMGAAVWHLFGHQPQLAGDLFVAAAAGCLTMGFFFGALVWPIPEQLYSGWIRVLSAERYGLRIPITSEDSLASERFVGHFPRGLDMYLPEDRGVAELHASFVVDDNARYAVRGLSIKPTVIRRFLESVDLSYDPHRPAPLETDLRMEDVIRLGEKGETEVEFVMLPKEEM